MNDSDVGGPQLRAAVVVAGHLRTACSAEGRQVLLDQLALCRASFKAGCDPFISTWSTLDSSTRNWWMSPKYQLGQQLPWMKADKYTPAPFNSSAPCLGELSAALRPAMVSVEEQDNGQLYGDGGRWWQGRFLTSIRMNWAVMASAASLMQRHSISQNITYAAAIRLRPDAGSAHLKGKNGLPPPSVWQAMHAAAAARSYNSQQPALRRQRTSADVQDCRPQFGSTRWKQIDNCFWSAPASLLEETLFTVMARFDYYFREDVRPANSHAHHVPTKKQTLGVCDGSLFRFPETVINCAVEDLRGGNHSRMLSLGDSVS